MAELYLFKQDGVYTGFTPTLFSTTFNGLVYAPAIISRSAIDITDNLAKSPITITFDSLNSFAQSMLESLSEFPVLVTIYRNEQVYWSGQIISTARKSIAVIEIACDSSYTLAIKAGIRYRTNIHCNHTIYSGQCGVAPSLWAVSSGVITASSTILTIPTLTQPNGYFNGGLIVLENQTRSIVESIGTTISISSPFKGILVGVGQLYPGCALTETACRGFNNIANGLMFPRIPSTNPFSSQGML